MTPSHSKALGSKLAELFDIDPDSLGDAVLESVGAIARKEVERMARQVDERAHGDISGGRSACCAVSFSSADHFPKGAAWFVTWLPRGYAPTPDDRLICAFPDQEEWGDNYTLRAGNRPPMIEAVCTAITEALRTAREDGK